MSNSFLSLLAGLGGTTILLVILVPLIIAIVILVWIHNISLNSYRIYNILEDMRSEKVDDSYEPNNAETDENLQTVNLKGVFIGGDAQLVSRLRKHLPNFAFISKDATSFGESFVIGRVIVICPEEMNNKLKVFTFSMLGEHNIEGEVIVHSNEPVESILNKIAKKRV